MNCPLKENNTGCPLIVSALDDVPPPRAIEFLKCQAKLININEDLWWHIYYSKRRSKIPNKVHTDLIVVRHITGPDRPPVMRSSC